MHRQGVSVVLVEQKLAIALKVSTRVCVMGHGRSSSKARRTACARPPTFAATGSRSADALASATELGGDPP